MSSRQVRTIVLASALLVWCGLLVVIELNLLERSESLPSWLQFVLVFLAVVTALEFGRSLADQDQTVLEERVPASRFRAAIRDRSDSVSLLWPRALILLTLAALVLAVQRGEIDVVRAVALGLLSTAFILTLKGWSEDGDRSFGLETRWTGLGGGLGGWKIGRSTTQFLLLVFFGVLIFLLLPPVNETKPDEEKAQAGGDLSVSESARSKTAESEPKSDQAESSEGESVQDQEPEPSPGPSTEEEATVEEGEQSPSESQNADVGG